MLNTLLAHALVSGRILCPRCQSCLLAVGVRFASQSQTHYDVLGIQKSASQAEIRSAFLQMSKKLHPDINRKDPKNHEKFVKLNEAYTVLSKPMARREYDMNLAVRLQMQRQARNTSSSHVYGSSAWPGNNSDRQYDEAEYQRFWDETIWHMRDQTKDKEYEGKPYYGFTTRERFSNKYIVLGCLVFIMFGSMLQYAAISKSREAHRNLLDERDKQHFNNLAKARYYAQKHGNALQLQILKAKVTNTPLEGVPEEVIKDTFSDVKK